MRRKVIVLSVNASWNVVNFRMDLIAALQRQGYRVVALAPEDEYSARLSSFGVDFHPLRIDKQGISPARRAKSASRSLASSGWRQPLRSAGRLPTALPR